MTTRKTAGVKDAEKGTSGNPPSVRRSANREELRLRRIQALQMRLDGTPYREIAEATGVNHRTVRDDIEAMLRERDAHLVPQLRAIEEIRIDKALAAAAKVLNDYPGTELALKAVDRILRAVSLRARLLGLEAPVELTVRTFEKTQQDLELEEILREAHAHNEITRQQIMGGVTGDPDPAVG